MCVYEDHILLSLHPKLWTGFIFNYSAIERAGQLPQHSAASCSWNATPLVEPTFMSKYTLVSITPIVCSCISAHDTGERQSVVSPSIILRFFCPQNCPDVRMQRRCKARIPAPVALLLLTATLCVSWAEYCTLFSLLLSLGTFSPSPESTFR